VIHNFPPKHFAEELKTLTLGGAAVYRCDRPGRLENSREAAQDYSPRREPWVKI